MKEKFPFGSSKMQMCAYYYICLCLNMEVNMSTSAQDSFIL